MKHGGTGMWLTTVHAAAKIRNILGASMLQHHGLTDTP